MEEYTWRIFQSVHRSQKPVHGLQQTWVKMLDINKQNIKKFLKIKKNTGTGLNN